MLLTLRRRARDSVRGVPVAVAAALALTLAVACVSERQDATGPGQSEGTCAIPINSEAIGTTIVAIRDFQFQPAELTVKRGTTVTWVNCEDTGGDAHTSTSDAGVWSSDLLPVGATFSQRFDAAGTFPYHCAPHPFMQARVIVEE